MKVGTPDPARSALPLRRLVRDRPEALVTTARRAPIRVLLRPKTLGRLGPSHNGDAVIPVGAAARETWGDAWQPGDEEAIVWVLAPKVNEVLSELRQDPRVVDVRVSMRDVESK